MSKVLAAVTEHLCALGIPPTRTHFSPTAQKLFLSRHNVPCFRLSLGELT